MIPNGLLMWASCSLAILDCSLEFGCVLESFVNHSISFSRYKSPRFQSNSLFVRKVSF